MTIQASAEARAEAISTMKGTLSTRGGRLRIRSPECFANADFLAAFFGRVRRESEQTHAGEKDRDAKDVDERVALLAHHVTPGYGEVVLEHQLEGSRQK